MLTIPEQIAIYFAYCIVAASVVLGIECLVDRLKERK